MDVFYEGQELRLYTIAPFKTAAGVPTDPTTVTLKVAKPDGTETNYTHSAGQLTRNGEGDYEKRITPALGEAGIWGWRWTGTGAVVAVSMGRFRVREVI